MFDISFPELLICFVVALVVLGPERLPGVVRSVGRWTGKARVYMRNLSAELERETQVMELKKQLEDAQRTLREHSDLLHGETHKLVEETKAGIVPEAKPAAAIEPPAREPTANGPGA